MSEWKRKRFWEAAAPAEVAGGFTVQLDGRQIKTPHKSDFVLPTLGLAEAVAAEWDAQSKEIDPGNMPMTRFANSAIDKVAPQKAAVAKMLAEYGGTDLLCYRADAPEVLFQRQAEGWDPLLDWAERHLGARLVSTTGLMHVDQDPVVLERLHAQVAAFDQFSLAGFHDLVTLSGSLVLGFAVAQGAKNWQDAWSLSRIDEDFQIEEWGDDEEAAEAASVRRGGFEQAALFYQYAQKT